MSIRKLSAWPAYGVLLAWLVIGSRSAVPALREGRTSARNRLEVIQQQYVKACAEFSASLEALAADCRTRGLDGLAREIDAAARPVDTSALGAVDLPSTVQPEIPANLPQEERQLRIRLRKLQREHAVELYLLSRRALHAGFPAFAYDLLRDVVRHDPDHSAARGLLGYVRFENEWVTPFTAQMRRRRYVWHERFGWLPKTHVARYENGERYYQGRWISAAREAEIRRDFRHAWTVRTDHYLVKTNHSLERGVEIARKLEQFHRFFVHLFAGFYNTPEQLEKLFEGGARRTRSPVRNDPHEVHLYATRDEYNRRLAAKIPQVGITNGLYITNDRIAYFFHSQADEADRDRTLYHEATHQILYESESRDRLVGRQAHFWIVEGIACYMESYRRDNGRFVVGDPDYIRFRAARYRYLDENFYVPLERFSAMGMTTFQTSRNISKLYSQASGLAHFFMHFEGGRYRDALIDYLAAIYGVGNRRSTQVPGLDTLTGVSYAELDRQYGEHLRRQRARLGEGALRIER